MVKLLEVSTATPTRESATRLAEAAIKVRLAAGGQVSGPVMSLFWHDGEFGTGEEWTVTLKTTADRYPELEELLVQQHDWKIRRSRQPCWSTPQLDMPNGSNASCASKSDTTPTDWYGYSCRPTFTSRCAGRTDVMPTARSRLPAIRSAACSTSPASR
jgi:periplasmic divalent cation tolerance protein